MSEEKTFPHKKGHLWLFSDMKDMLELIMYGDVRFSDEELIRLPVVYATFSYEILEVLRELDNVDLPDSVLTTLDEIYEILNSYQFQTEESKEKYKVLNQKDSYRLLGTLRVLKENILSEIVKPALKEAYTS